MPLKKGERRSYLEAPMAAMGQKWLQPNGPDGWPEQVEAWITPHGLAARLSFAAENAESRREGIRLILASPAFQRR